MSYRPCNITADLEQRDDMSGENSTPDTSDQVTELDLDIRPNDVKRSGRGLLVASAAIALVGALLIGAFIAADNDSELDVAADEDSVPVDDEDEDTPTTAVPGDEPSVSPSATFAPSFAVSEEASRNFAASDVAYGYGGPNAVVFADGQFVALGYSGNGPTLRTSTDGIEWTEMPFPATEGSNVSQLAEYDGTFVAIIEQWEDSEDEGRNFFGPVDGPTQHLASSTDLVDWTLTELPKAADSADGAIYTGVNGLAIDASGVIILTQSHSEGPNEMQILFDAGILVEADLERYCGIRVDDEGEPFEVQLCGDGDGRVGDVGGFSEEQYEKLMERYDAAETQEERLAIGAEFEELQSSSHEGEVVAVINPDDPLYAELGELYFGRHEEDLPDVNVLSGPVTGPFSSSSLPAEGYPTGLVSSNGTFFTLIENWTEAGNAAQILSSDDGTTWSAVGTLPQNLSGQLSAVGDALFVVGGNEQGPQAFSSSDAGVTWAEATIPTELFGAYPQIVSGPAGAIALVQGSTEATPEYGPEGPIVVTRDGYTLTLSYGPDRETVTLAGPDGVVIYELSEAEMYGDGDADGIVRTSPFTGTPTFLDPETGDDMVTFTDEDFEKAYGSIERDFEEPDFETEIWFSTDGSSWTQIVDDRLENSNNSGISPVAVGDDEAIFVKHTWVEPPAEIFVFEEEGREPTEAEIAVLEAWERDADGGQQTEYIRIDLG
jgi:hypothetical protein